MNRLKSYKLHNTKTINYKRSKKKGSFDWNKVLFPRFDDQIFQVTAFPSVGYFKFEKRYQEDPDDGATKATLFEDLNFSHGTVSAGDILTGAKVLLCNTLKPFEGWGASDSIAPFGAAELARMYSHYRVTSIDAVFKFMWDITTLQSLHELGKICIGVIKADSNDPLSVSDAQIKEGVRYGKIPVVPFLYSTVDNHFRATATLRIQNLNIIDQFQQDPLSVNIEKTDVFAATLGSGSFATITGPATSLALHFFIYVDVPSGRIGIPVGDDGDIDILTSAHIVQHCQLTGPSKKTVDA